ncbi:glycine-rich cell wall structural protein 1.0-like [Branchiostoma floridae]|uniref:Glycine-rich cell wall structural protein 1.0-like n=1 Tax=Branchiostoma floridae TaxID=7739 RepID=A0A9J7KYA6_BRAFL|nr:glycine-rich cell wall structural protein 1.0-like [Branchiostoma floridae]
MNIAAAVKPKTYAVTTAKFLDRKPRDEADQPQTALDAPSRMNLTTTPNSDAGAGTGIEHSKTASGPSSNVNDSLADWGFRNANFTTLNATGRAGPTSLGDHYRGQDHEKLVTLQNGIQLFTVPDTDSYQIEVAGAAGGWDEANSNENYRGYGAMMKGTFNLTQGDVLKILVGQEGVGTSGSLSTGGGGGTFVTRLNNTPLIIAGGGGGMQWLSRVYESCDGTTLTSGQRSYKGTKGRAGNSDDEVNAGGSDGHGATEGKGYLGGGGGGLLTNGGSGYLFMPGSGTIGGEGGYAFVNGGKGGRGLPRGYTAEGGFGGGGAGSTPGKGSGGGGGYSGGGRGMPNMCECGGGGGSFNAGTNTSGKNGTNAGPGYATIVRLLD